MQGRKDAKKVGYKDERKQRRYDARRKGFKKEMMQIRKKECKGKRYKEERE